MLETYVLHITKECNMACRYCYETDKTSIYEWDEIKVILDNIIKHNDHFNLEFLGGEPCLRIDLIRNVVEYLSAINHVNVEQFHITTNGTIINDDLISLMKKYENVNYTTSMDGTPLMNCLRIMKTGYNSHDIAVENLKVMLKEFDSETISIHMVTHPFNIGYYNEGITHLYDIGIRSFGIGTIESTIIIDEDYCSTFIKQNKILSDRIKRGELPGIRIGLFESLKPKSDSRHYIKDKTGRTLLETYGRKEDDIKDSDEYKTPPAGSPLGDMIYKIRETVYNYHNGTKYDY